MNATIKDTYSFRKLAILIWYIIFDTAIFPLKLRFSYIFEGFDLRFYH